MNQTRILIAEDDQDDFLTIKMAFEDLQMDFILERVEDGQQLLKWLYACRKNKEEYPDLIMLDFHMPKLNGLETLEQLHKMDEFRQIPVIMHSTIADPDVKAKCKGLGISGFFSKGNTQTGVRETAENIVNFLNKETISHAK